MDTAQFYLDFTECERFAGTEMQRWVQFCLCWCLGWFQRVHGVCTHLNWARGLTVRTLKPPFLGYFGTYTDSLVAHTQPDRISRVALLCFTGEKVQISSCAQQCWAASPVHLSSNSSCQVYADLPGCQGFVPKLFAEAGLSLNPLVGKGGGLASQVLLVKLMMTQRWEWVQGLGCGCCSCLYLMPCIVLVVAAECRHQRGELTV